ncbi:MAG: TonB-dependent receptor [Deltaproteobacteria bacterium]|jgi:hemoglobin/transferrin/lactoferrin receptor protein|nr:TonB-dependent receptor [Deltaproteobacteria bacterium]
MKLLAYRHFFWNLFGHLKGFSKLFAGFILLLSLTVITLKANPVLAQENNETIRVTSIMVTVSRVLQELMDVPMTVNVVTAEQIQDEPYANIADLLDNIPGIMLDYTSAMRPGAARITIRGENNFRTLILINGVKSADKDGADNTLLIDLSQVERIEVIKGPASVLYGPEAIGGVINIITKKGGTKPFGFSQNFVYDSSTDSLESQTAIFGRYKGFNYRVSGNGVNVHNRKVPKNSLPGNEAVTSHYRNRYYSVQFGYNWGVNEENSFSIQADRFKNTAYYANGIAAMLNNTIMWVGPNDRDTLTGTLILSDLTDNLKKLTLLGSYQEFNRHIVSDFNDPDMYIPPYMDMFNKGINHSKQKQTTISAQAEWLLGDHHVITGFEYEHDDVTISVSTYPYTPNLQPFFSNGNVVQDTIGIFAQDEWSITDKLTATLGLRFSHISGEYKSKEGNGLANKTDSNKDNKDSHLVASVGLVYRVIDALALRFQFSQGYRYPTIRQLYTGTSGHAGPNITTYPNPDLLPETSNNFEIGMRYMDTNWDVDLAVFYSSSKRFIQSVTAAESPIGVATYINGVEAKTFGAEFSASYAILLGERTLTPYGSATYLVRDFTFGAGRLKDQSTRNTGVPKLEGRLGVKFDTPITGSHKFFSDLYVQMAVKSYSDFTLNSYSAGSTLTNPAWQNVSLNLGVKGGEDHKYHVTLALRNIFNQAYTLGSSRMASTLPEPGFHVVLSAGFEY